MFVCMSVTLITTGSFGTLLERYAAVIWLICFVWFFFKADGRGR